MLTFEVVNAEYERLLRELYNLGFRRCYTILTCNKVIIFVQNNFYLDITTENLKV